MNAVVNPRITFQRNPLTERHATECGNFHWTVEASDIGLRPGVPMPRRIETTLGNGQPFVYIDHEEREGDIVCWNYRQMMGVLTLRIFND